MCNPIYYHIKSIIDDYIIQTIRKQPIKNQAKDLNGHLIKGDIQTANVHLKRCSLSHVIRELEIKQQ